MSAIVFVALALVTPSLWAHDGLIGAVSRLDREANALHDSFGHRLAAADFDNDQKPDGAVLLDAGRLNGQRVFHIEIHVTGSDNDQLTFESNETGLTITALDVNQDGMPDIVVEQTLTRKPLHVWLNDGHGQFHKAKAEKYPKACEPYVECKSPSQIQNISAICLPSKFGPEFGVLRSAMLPPGSSLTRQNVWPEMLLAQLGPRSPNPTRGPPSLLFL